MKKLICNDIARWRPATLGKKLFTHPSSCILPSFSQNASRLLLLKRFWKCASTISFRKYKWKVVLLLIYLFNHESSKSTFFMLNMTSDVLLSTPFTRTLHEHPLHCSVVCPLVVLVCPIVVSVCPFLVPVVLSVGLFITDLLFVLICTFL